MKKEKLPRGLRRRENSLVVSFARADGTIARRSLGMVSVGFAAEQRGIFMRQVREGVYEGRKPRVKETVVADLFPLYLVDFENRGGRDPRRWRLAWNHLEPWFGSLAVGEVSTAKINEYIAARKALGRSNGTINRELTLLKALFRFGTKQTPVLVERVPSFPRRLAEPPPRRGFVSSDEYKTLCSNAKELWLRALVSVAHTYGFRKGEALAIRVRQIDLLDRWITLEAGATKNGEGRRVRITEEVY